MNNKQSVIRKSAAFLVVILLIGLSVFGLNLAQKKSDNHNQSQSSSPEKNSKEASSNNKNGEKVNSETARNNSSDGQISLQPTGSSSFRSHQVGSSRFGEGRKDKSKVAAENPTKEDENDNYVVRYIDQAGRQISSELKFGPRGDQVRIVAADLFKDGYELFDQKTKNIKIGSDKEVVFRYGKARELMSLTEFTRYPVNYDYPLEYRNLDFTNRQSDLEEFVIKKIYQGDKTTGKFYGTKDQAYQVRQTLLNGSFQGAYARYATNMVPSLPKHIEGDKYEHSIDFTYHEHRENMILGEQKINKIVAKYNKLNLSDIEKAKLIHDWLIKNPKVFNPPHTGQEWFYNSKKNLRVHFPASLVLDGEGVCLTYAMTYGRMAELMGLEVRLIQGYIGLSESDNAARAQEMFNNPDSTTYIPRYLNHTWNIVKVDGVWHHVDTFQTIGFLPFTKNNPQPYLYLLQDQAMMRESTIKMGRGKRLSTYTVHRAWNTNRIPDAPTANLEATKLPDISQKDI